MTSKLNKIILLIKERLVLFVSISLGVFLFVLFFHPFPIDGFDFNNRLIFVAGLAVIVFIVMILVRISFSEHIQNYTESRNGTVLPYYMGSFIMLVLSSAALAFYLNYVGSVEITFYIMFKVVLICLGPPVSLWIYDALKEYKDKNELLLTEIERIKEQVVKYEEDYLNISIDLVSDNSSENLNLLIADVALIKSANNYVEIIFRDGDHYHKHLLRATLKNIEQQLRPYTNFIRCHRTCIVNAHYIETLSRKFNNHWLIIKGYDEQVPVSRQYLLKLKEAL